MTISVGILNHQDRPLRILKLEPSADYFTPVLRTVHERKEVEAVQATFERQKRANFKQTTHPLEPTDVRFNVGNIGERQWTIRTGSRPIGRNHPLRHFFPALRQHWRDQDHYQVSNQ
jgi:hypothetical protein